MNVGSFGGHVSNISPHHLPPQILAPEGLSNLVSRYAASGSSTPSRRRPSPAPIRMASAASSSKKKKKPKTTTTTTRPPIVWFPGDPDCGETPTSSFSNTFQLIAFLLSVFNISQSLNANANNNNNNNNVNDNKGNVNENDNNESNANSEVMAMNMIMPGRNIPFPVEARMVEGYGGTKAVHFSRSKRDSEVNLEKKADLSQVIMDFVQLWFKMLASNSKDCQRKYFCEVNEAVSRSSSLNWVLAEVASLGVAKHATRNPKDRDHLILSGKYGRAGLNCSLIYDECNPNEQRFVTYATDIFPWSPSGERRYLENLVGWALGR